MNPLFALLFACFSGVSSQCNLVEISKCFIGSTVPEENSDLQTACKSFRQVTSCIEPYKSACAADSTFQSMMSGINMAAGYCGGDSSCNPMKCYTEAGIDMNSGNDPQNMNCEVYVTVKTCLDSQKNACEGNTIYSTVQGSLQPVEKLCGSSGMSSECDMIGMASCIRGFTMPKMNSTTDLQTTCKSFRQVTSCIEPYKSACAGDSTFQSMMSGINMAAVYCGGDSNCNLMKCYTNAGFNMTNRGMDLPNMNCEVYATVKTCLDGQKSACEGNTLYSTVQDSLQPVEKLCSSSDGSSCGILKCFTDAGINLNDLSDNPREISCGTFQVLEPCFESQRNACQGNQLYTLAESYRPQIKERCRQQLQQGSTDGGTSCVAANWILLSVALLAMAAISQ